MTRQVRQGDVLLVPVRALPAGLRPVAPDRGRVTLAYGEVTGHAHAFAPGAAVALLEVAEPVTIPEATDPVSRFLEVTDLAALGHEEHATIHVAPGRYAVITPREYTPWGDRAVLD